MTDQVSLDAAFEKNGTDRQPKDKMSLADVES